jgi:hypothetical protein
MGFPTRSEYESLIYRLTDDSLHISASTLRLYSTSALTAIVEGSIHFRNGLELRMVEALDFKSGRIQRYSYTILRGTEKVRWYDPEPHPEASELADTFPHHRHEPPDIKHNRRPAPGISFTTPNLATLIADCVQLGEQLGHR